MTSDIVQQVTDAAARREALVQAQKGKLADQLDQFMNAGLDGEKLAEAKAEAQAIDPTFSVECAAFHAGTVVGLKDPEKKLAAARANATKKEKALAKLQAEYDQARQSFEKKIAEAIDSLDAANDELAGYQLDADRIATLRGDEIRPGCGEYAGDVIRAWAKRRGIV